MPDIEELVADVAKLTKKLEEAEERIISIRNDIEQTRRQPFVGAVSINTDLPSGTSKIGNPLQRIPNSILFSLPSAAVYVYQTPADVAATTDKTIQITTSGATEVTIWVV